MNGLRSRVLSALAGQLGHPHGLLGKGVVRILNRGNARAIAGAVDAAVDGGAQAVADIGFGGGAGLSMLLEQADPAGVVHGIELSADMLARARKVFAREVNGGRLQLTEGSLTDLPLPDATLDAAITVNTVYFVPDLDAACAELARVLRPKGRLVVGIGDPDVMAKAPFTPYGFILRPVGEVVTALERAGFHVEQRKLDQQPIPHHLLVARPSAT